ncbi:MAG: methyltransferase, partial [Prevotella sp.]|nr:methyltransferase [Prevotella sp.]
AQSLFLRHFGHRNIDVSFAADSREDIDNVLHHLHELGGIIVDSFTMETATMPQQRYTVTMQLRLERRKYRNRILEFIDELKGVDVLRIE